VFNCNIYHKAIKVADIFSGGCHPQSFCLQLLNDSLHLVAICKYSTVYINYSQYLVAICKYSTVYINDSLHLVANLMHCLIQVMSEDDSHLFVVV